MLNKQRAKKRASVLKQLEAFQKCAKTIINNGMNEEDQALFKHNDIKKARLANIGITIRVATIKANVQVTNEATREINKALLTMQKSYTQNNLDQVLKGKNG